jgi:trk system potassium uptake protein TrkH
VNLRLDVRILGSLAGLMGAFMALPLIVALARGEAVRPFIAGAAVGLAAFLVGWLAGRGATTTLRPRDGFLVVTLGWLVASAIAAAPYLVAGALGPADAWFEAVSGITTTGSTVLADIEAWPRSLLMWRSLTQWLGGMGIILFTIAILPLLGVGGMQLFRAEVPGPVADKLAPRIAVTARYLWFIYVGLTVLEGLLLLMAGLPLLDAADHALTTMATGGFSPKTDSIGAYGAPARWVVIVFMALAGMNFVLHFKLVMGRFGEVFRDEELRWYLCLIALFAVPVVLVLALSGTAPLQALENGLFTVVSLMTTTGYATTDFELWPSALIGPLGLLLVLGGMAGSTGGGIKTLRTLLAVRSLKASFARMLHPHAVRPVTYKRRPVAPAVSEAVWGFFAAYILLAILGMIVVNASGENVVTAWTAALTAIGNVGPGLGDVGPSDHFGHLAWYAKLTLSFLMLCGRLEVYTVLIVLAPGFWRR